MSDKEIFEKMKKERDAWLAETGKTVVKNKCDAATIEQARKFRAKRGGYARPTA